MRYVFHSQVDKVEERRHVGRTIKRGDDVIEENVTTSWFVVIDRVAFDFGSEKPEFKNGDIIKMTLEKMDVHK